MNDPKTFWGMAFVGMMVLTSCTIGHAPLRCEGGPCIFVDTAEAGDAPIDPDADVVNDTVPDEGMDIVDVGSEADGNDGSDGTDATDTPDAVDATEDHGPTDVLADIAPDAADVSDVPDVRDVVDAADVATDVPVDAPTPNLTIRWSLSTTPVLLFIETTPASMVRVALTPAMCVGGLRVVGGGVECLYATPLTRGTEIRFNFSLVPMYPAMDDQWLCNGASAMGCNIANYVVTFNGMPIPAARFSLQALLDGRGVLTRFHGTALP